MAHDAIAPPRKSVFHERLAALGYATYEDYLSSDHWKSVRKAYWRSSYPKSCFCCGAPGRELHHPDYNCLGRESLGHLVLLCREHHERVHQMTREGVGLAQAHLSLRAQLDPKPTKSQLRAEKKRQKKAKQRAKYAVRKAEKKAMSADDLAIAVAGMGKIGWRATSAKPSKQKKPKKQNLTGYRPQVGGGIPVKIVKADGTVVRNTDQRPAEPPRKTRRSRRRATASNSPAGAPGGSSGSTRSSRHA